MIYSKFLYTIKKLLLLLSFSLSFMCVYIYVLKQITTDSMDKVLSFRAKKEIQQPLFICQRPLKMVRAARVMMKSHVLLIFLSRRFQRILRPLVLDTLFRASSFRSRYALCNERKRRIASYSEALSPLRLSIRGNRVGHTL